MTDRIEPRLAGVADGRDGVGHEGMTEGGSVVTDRTEPRVAGVADGRDGEGHEGTTKEALS